MLPYTQKGKKAFRKGKRALQAILNAGGFISFEGMEYVKELGA